MMKLLTLFGLILIAQFVAGPLPPTLGIELERGFSLTKPNIVLIVVDDLGWNDVGYHNSEMHTPNIDRFVQENIELKRFYVAPQCSPTRAGLLTGRYPHRFGMLDHVISPTQNDGLPESEYTVAEMLGDSGYEDRAMIGKWHLGLRSKIFHPLNHGFTEFYGHYNGAIDYFRHVRRGELDWHRDYQTVEEPGYSTALLTDEAVRFIQENRVATSPFFLYLAYNAPHSPLQALDEDLELEGFKKSAGRMQSDDLRLAKREGDLKYGLAGTGNNKRQTFKANVRALDRNLGRLFKAIDDSGEGENTLVLLTSDNGGIPSHGGSNSPLRGNKFQIYEGGVRVPAALRWPAAFPQPKVIEDTLSYVDVWPTLAAIVGHQTKIEIDGQDMLPRCNAEEASWDRTLYLREGGVIDGEWKLVAMDKDGADIGKSGQLYHLKNDPFETKDLAKKMPVKVRELAALVEEHRQLKGPAFKSQYKGDWPPKNWKLPDEPKE
ncbi:MAG: sulfatase-like hydrolase/transferase [Planctomycetota bacterium]